MIHTFHIRPYRDGDVKQILELRRVVFGDIDPMRLKENIWQWQFQNNPSGEAICFLAESQGKIVGQYAAIPTRFSIHGQETLLWFSCDTMVHPDFRRQGIFFALARELYRFLEILPGINLVWGFPNDKSLAGFTGKLGWRTLPSFPLMVIPIRPLNMIFPSISLLKKTGKLLSGSMAPDAEVSFSTKIQGIHLDPIEQFDETFDSLWQKHSTLAPVIQVRDRSYLQWRYLSVPEFGYRPFAVRRDGCLIAYAVIRMMTLKGRTFGVLADLFPLISFPILFEIFSFAKRFVKANGGDFLTCLFPHEQTWILKKAGFRQIPEIFNPKIWRLGYRRAVGCPLENLAGWHVTYGDTDVV